MISRLQRERPPRYHFPLPGGRGLEHQSNRASAIYGKSPRKIFPILPDVKVVFAPQTADFLGSHRPLVVFTDYPRGNHRGNAGVGLALVRGGILLLFVSPQDGTSHHDAAWRFSHHNIVAEGLQDY